MKRQIESLLTKDTCRIHARLDVDRRLLALQMCFLTHNRLEPDLIGCISLPLWAPLHLLFRVIISTHIWCGNVIDSCFCTVIGSWTRLTSLTQITHVLFLKWNRNVFRNDVWYIKILKWLTTLIPYPLCITVCSHEERIIEASEAASLFEIWNPRGKNGRMAFLMSLTLAL